MRKLDPRERKTCFTFSVDSRTLKNLDDGLEGIRQAVKAEFQLTDDDKRILEREFNRSAVLRQMIESAATPAGMANLLAGIRLNLLQRGFVQNVQFSMFGKKDDKQ